MSHLWIIKHFNTCYINRFVERLSTLQWDSMTTVDEMENEEEIKMEIREEYNKR